MSNDLGLLTLVIDDPLAPRLLAWWKKSKPAVAAFPELQAQIATMIQAKSMADVRATFDRCEFAGLLLDGGITETAEKWMQAVVAQRLGVKPRAPAPPKPKKG